MTVINKSIVYQYQTMSVDKFGCHISKRNILNTTTLENTVLSNVENKILNRFKTDVNYIENKVIEHFQGSIDNTNKRLSENESNYNNFAKKIKFFDEKITKHEDKIVQFNDNIKTINNLKTEIEQIKNSINDTSQIESIKRNLQNDIKTKFEDFTNKVYERVNQEVAYFKDVHDKIDRTEKITATALNMHIVNHKKDIEELQDLRQQFNNTLAEITKLKSEKILESEDRNKSKSEISTIKSSLEKFNLKLDELYVSLESLKEYVKEENKKINADIDEIDKTMNTQIREVIIKNQKERIKHLRNDIDNIDQTKSKLINDTLNGKKLSVVSLEIRQYIQNLSQNIYTISKKLEEELRKIETEVENSANKTKDFLLTTVKEYLDNLVKEIIKINEILIETNKDEQIQKLKEWIETYKSFVDNYSQN